MKNTYIIIVVLVVLAVVGFFMFGSKTTPVESMPQGKIDVTTACRSALAYMTFTTGEEAEVFVAECIDGKYPDVIQRYVKDLGVDGATI